ncbi:MAG TPA: RsmG family class I SAM-dependent methyltransferase [Candidatus Eisenbacteria bacterium]
MRSESGAAPDPKIPADVATDLETFRSRIQPALERQAAAVAAPPRSATHTLELLVRFGLLVHGQAAEQAIIAKGDRPHVFTRHVLDSLNPLALFPKPPESALDVGTGAGFPGIPLAVLWPTTRFTLLESREKKAGFVERAARELELGNVRVVCDRLEALGRTWRLEPTGAMFVRAVAGLGTILRHAAPAAAPGCRWVYFMGAASDESSIEDELLASGFDSSPAAGAFGGRLLTGTFPPR